MLFEVEEEVFDGYVSNKLLMEDLMQGLGLLRVLCVIELKLCFEVEGVMFVKMVNWFFSFVCCVDFEGVEIFFKMVGVDGLYLVSEN